ncbi:MAG: SOS response-associated peptidase [Pseudomonadota bacterium]
MCGRYTLSESPAEIADAFDDVLGVDCSTEFSATYDWQPRYNIAPSQYCLVAACVGSAPELALMRWGLIPHWAKDQKIANKLINARAETVAEKPSFRTAFRHKRCLVFASGYYEWTKRDGQKYPVHITSTQANVIAFAGLWSSWSGDDTDTLNTFTIITTSANADIDSVHHRMPVTLTPSDAQLWLSRTPDQADSLALLRPAPDGTFSHCFVSNYVNAPRNEGPECVQAISAP